MLIRTTDDRIDLYIVIYEKEVNWIELQWGYNNIALSSRRSDDNNTLLSSSFINFPRKTFPPLSLFASSLAYANIVNSECARINPLNHSFQSIS